MKLPFEIDLKGKVAVVTGGGGVLCSGFAKTLAACGAKVAVCDLRLEAAEAVVVLPLLSCCERKQSGSEN